MKAIQLLAAALLIIGAVAAVFTIWQIVETSAAGPGLTGPAPILIGDAPPPRLASPTPESQRPGPTPPPPTDIAALAAAAGSRNLAPATAPAGSALKSGEIEMHEVETPTASAPSGGSANSAASRTTGRDTFQPGRIFIPAADVNASIIPVGLNERSEMASPDDFEQVGWWQFGASPGEYGRAVLAGHVDSPTGEAIFYGIDRLSPGDEIIITAAEDDPRELRFVVTGAALYHIDHAPVDQIFGPSNERELILITCGGAFDRDTGAYLYRRVVFATLSDSSG